MHRKKNYLMYLIFTLLVIFPSYFILPAGAFFKLEKVATSDLPDNIVAPDLKSLTIDPRGNIFAFAGKPGGGDCFIVKFNEKLAYQSHFGTVGKGPGSFTTHVTLTENRLSIDEKGDVYVRDSNPCRLVVFDNNGKYKEDIQIHKDYFQTIGNLNTPKVIRKGLFMAFKYHRNKPLEGILFNKDSPKVLVHYPFYDKIIKGYHTSPYYGHMHFADTDSRLAVFADSQVFKFEIYDSDGKAIVKVEDPKRVMGKFSAREMEMIRNEFFTPQSHFSPMRNSGLKQLNANKPELKTRLSQVRNSKNVITKIMISGDHVYVFTVPRDITEKEKWPVEIYDLKGRLIKNGFFKQIPARIHKGAAFFYQRDDEDNPLIVKYKLLMEQGLKK